MKLVRLLDRTLVTLLCGYWHAFGYSQISFIFYLSSQKHKNLVELLQCNSEIFDTLLEENSGCGTDTTE